MNNICFLQLLAQISMGLIFLQLSLPFLNIIDNRKFLDTLKKKNNTYENIINLN